MEGSIGSSSDLVREQASQNHVQTARRKGLDRFSINAGDIQRETKLQNRIPLVCMALKSKKFLQANGIRLISESGPPSGLSTTVTYTYEFVDGKNSAAPRAPGGSGSAPQSRQAAWEKLRGALKDVFAEYGGGEAYLRAERASFHDADERK